MTYYDELKKMRDKLYWMLVAYHTHYSGANTLKDSLIKAYDEIVKEIEQIEREQEEWKNETAMTEEQMDEMFLYLEEERNYENTKSVS